MDHNTNDFLLNSNYRRVPLGGKPINPLTFPWPALVTSLIALAFCLICILFCTHIYNDINVYCSHRIVQGRVAGGRTTYSEGNTTYYLQYSYTADGQIRSGEDIVSGELYRALKKDDGIPLQVSNINPDAACVQGQFQAFALFWQLTGLSLFFMVFNVDLLTKTLAYRRHSACLKHGRRVTGTALLTGDTGEYGYRVTAKYSFKSPRTRREITGTETLISDDLKDQPLAKNVQVQLLYVDDRTHMML
jgi:hypothetical protein